MKYVNREMKIDQIIGYFNNRKINLIPPFQRGTVWTLPMRQRLIQNIVHVRPIPAIFLYKEPAGNQFDYNILDGKQRLESLILFVGNKRAEFKVDNIQHYFYGNDAIREVNFPIQINDKEQAFKDLDDELIRKFKDFSISTIEIDLDDDEASIDEIVKLFVDVNLEGIRVGKFDIVKAFGSDPLFKQVFGLIGTKKSKKKSVYLRPKNGSFSYVLGNLNIIKRMKDENSQVNRMWERMTEIALYSRLPHQHRAPAQILKGFIRPGRTPNKRLREDELKKLRLSFGFLETAYKHSSVLAETKMATDQPQFYTLITILISTDLLDKYSAPELEKRILIAAQIMEGAAPEPPNLKKWVRQYQTAAAKQTTNPNRRAEREEALIKVIQGVEVVSNGQTS